MVEHLPNMLKVLSLIPRTKTTQRRRESEREITRLADIWKEATRSLLDRSDLQGQNKGCSQASSRLC